MMRWPYAPVLLALMSGCSLVAVQLFGGDETTGAGGMGMGGTGTGGDAVGGFGDGGESQGNGGGGAAPMGSGGMAAGGATGGNISGTGGNGGSGPLCNGIGEWSDATTGSCYRLDTTPLNWVTARNNCINWGGNLVGIETQAEYTMILANHPGGSMWTGANDRMVEGTWEWSNGEPWSYEQWNQSPLQPNGGSGESCGIIASTNTNMWDEDCPNTYAFICERP